MSASSPPLRRRLVSAATVAIALAAAGPVSLTQAAAPAAPRAPVDPCALSEYAGDTYFPDPAFREQTDAPAILKSAPYRVETVAKGLVNPRALAFIGEGRLLVSERPGSLRVIGADGQPSSPLTGVPTPMQGPLDGFDFTLDPGFATNRILYLAYRIPKPGQVLAQGQRATGVGQVARARLSADGRALEDLKVIYEGGHLRRVTATRDGKLFITTLHAEGPASQNLDNDAGKVLRINTDGSIPRDNPFVRRKGALPAIYAYGHRDVDGVAIAPTGQLYTIEHGPRGGDELNLIRPGRNYGFPVIGYGREYSNAQINKDKTQQPGMEQPVYFWSSPDIGPGGLLVYSGAMFPEWQGDIFAGALATKRLVRLNMRGGKVVGEEHLIGDRCRRIRDVKQASDGSLYVLTNFDANSEILRIFR